MLLQLYYLGELFETKETPQRNLNQHPYLNKYYLQMALKTYRLFEELGPSQILRTKILSTTHIHKLTNAHIKEILSQAQEINNFQPEVENQGEESVTLEHLYN